MVITWEGMGSLIAGILTVLIVIARKLKGRDLGFFWNTWFPKKEDPSQEEKDDNTGTGIAKLVQERDEARKAEWEEHCGGCRTDINRKLTATNEKASQIEDEASRRFEVIDNSLQQGNARFNELEKCTKDIPKIRNGVIALASLLGNLHYSSAVISEYLMQEHKELIPKLMDTERKQKAFEQLKKDLEGET